MRWLFVILLTAIYCSYVFYTTRVFKAGASNSSFHHKKWLQLKYVFPHLVLGEWGQTLFQVVQYADSCLDRWITSKWGQIYFARRGRWARRTLRSGTSTSRMESLWLEVTFGKEFAPTWGLKNQILVCLTVSMGRERINAWVVSVFLQPNLLRLLRRQVQTRQSVQYRMTRVLIMRKTTW